jgi:hypothetical protein
LAPPERDIDAHSLIWTPDVAHSPLANGFKVGGMKGPSFTAEELLAFCRPAGSGRMNLIWISSYDTDNRYSIRMNSLPTYLRPRSIRPPVVA